jgi:membrane protease YdiL (CAAX protease family)
VLSPDWPWTRLVLALALLALVALLVLRAVSRDRGEYPRFTRFERTRNRQRMMRRWLVSSALTFGGASILLLLLAGRYVPLLLEAVRGWPVGRWFSGLVEASDGRATGLAITLAALVVLGTIVAVWFARNSTEVPTIGNIGALLPRNRAELRYGVALSINAGLMEELLFRLAVPAALFGASGSAVVAVVGSVALFGALHLYQGLPGILGSTIIGALLMALYLATGTIVVPIVAHALIDLRSLVLIPVLVYRVQRK